MKKVIRISLVAVFVLTLASYGYCATADSKNILFSSPEKGVIKAMTFNIRVDTIIDGLNRWCNRKEMVVDTIADNAPDVIGLQEALYSQSQYLRKALPQYGMYAAGRNDGKRKGESCAILYRKDRYIMIDSGTFWFSDTPSVPGSKDWGNLPPRICSWVYLIDCKNLNRFYVYNVHLDNFSENSREKSVRLLAKKVAARKTNAPFIVMGDFNMGINEPAMRYLRQIGSSSSFPRMVDAWQLANPGRVAPATRHSFRGHRSGPKIDHIPIGEHAKVLEATIDRRSINGRYPSDHFPVIATILLDSPVITYRDSKPNEIISSRPQLNGAVY